MDALSVAIHHFFESVSAGSPQGAVLLETPCLVESASAVVSHHTTISGWNPCRTIVLQGNRLCLYTQGADTPAETMTLTLNEEGATTLWEQVEQFLATVNDSHKVFIHVGYEATRWMDPDWHGVSFHEDESGSGDFPDLIVMEMSHWAQWRREESTEPVSGFELVSVPVTFGGDSSVQQAMAALWEASIQLAQSKVYSTDSATASHSIDLTQYAVSQTPEVFAENANQVLSAIQRGELYQANLSLAFSKETRISPMDLYRQLVRHNPSPFGGLFVTPLGHVVSNSPERLVDLKGVGAKPGDDAGDDIGRVTRRRASCRPIAGTRGRKPDPAEDAALADTLRNDPKEQSEHVMLLDLIRNDLGRVAVAGTVSVDELMVIERYRHVMHLVSHVSGELPDVIHPWAHVVPLLQATFPGGTITGCPKIRCVEWLAKLESHRRGPYTGSMGYYNPATGEMDLNILIRTALMQPFSETVDQRSRIQFCVGAGLVADSVPEYEYKECLRKAQSMLLAIASAEAEAEEGLSNKDC